MRFQKILCSVLSATLVVAFAPHAAFAQEAPSDSIADQEAAALDQTLSENDYAQGQAIVVVDTSAADSLAGAARSLLSGEDLLAGAEDIMGASGSSFTKATGQEQSTDVQVKCVTSSTLSTKELISKLLEDPRVISAEPNVQASTASVDAEGSASAAASKAESGASTRHMAAATTNTATSCAVPKDSSKATNITGTDAMPDLSSYQWYASAKAGTMKQAGATDASSLDVPTWNSKANASGAVVAVMDSGVNYKHPDIQPNMMDMTRYNKGTAYEKVAGKYGYNAAGWDQESTSDPMDEEGHGTHVAGIMCANWDGKGTSGIAGGAKLVAVRITDNKSFSYLACLKGYQYLSKMMDRGLNLTSINCSWAGNSVSPALCLAMTELGQKGAVTCIASGNESKDISKVPYSTSLFATSPYAVVVNSSNIRGEQSDFSNYGQGVTDVYAPGSSILSSYLTSYLSYADPKPAYYENFASESAATSIIVRKSSEDAAPFGSGKEVGSYSTDASFDKGTGSLCIPLDKSKADQCFELQIPVSNEQLAASTHLGLTFCGKTKMLNVACSLAVADKNGSASWDISEDSNYVNTWVDSSIALSDSVESNGEASGIAVKDGYMSVKLTVSANSAKVMSSGDGMLYLDTIGLGSNVCDYRIEHGTSMATPCATASAAVISTQLKAQGKSGAQLAQQVARSIKGSVVQSGTMRANSTAGGYLSFGMLGAVTPVIESCKQSGSTLTLTGTGFGSQQGSVKVGSATASIKSWANSKIVLNIPSTVASGARQVLVTGANSRTGAAVASLSISKPTLYGKNIALPKGSGTPGGSPFTCMAAYKGKLYVLCSASFGDGVAYKQLWRYKISTKKWKRLANLPYSKAAKASMAIYKGKVMVACGGVLERSSLTKKNALYSYSPAKNKWTKLGIGKKLPYATALVKFGGRLLCVGGMQVDEYGSLSDVKKVCKLNLAKKTVVRIGKLSSAVNTAQASARKGTLYVSNGLNQEVTSSSIEKPVINAFRYKKGKLERYNMRSALPKAAKGYMNTYGAAASPSGLIISGYPARTSSGTKSTHDTYKLTLSKKGVAKCKKLAKSFSYNTALQLTSRYYKGWIYTLGCAYNESAPAIMKAAKI